MNILLYKLNKHRCRWQTHSRIEHYFHQKIFIFIILYATLLTIQISFTIFKQHPCLLKIFIRKILRKIEIHYFKQLNLLIKCSLRK